MNEINCLKCRYFYVTWEISFPRGCKAYGFKTDKIPSTVVFQSSGTKCLHYQQKETNMDKANSES